MKLIINCEPDDFILAVRSAKWLLDHPEHQDVITAYEGGKDFHSRRRKACISVRDISRA